MEQAPLAYSPAQALAVVPIGRTKLFAEIAAGRLRVAKCGRRTVITRAALLEWLEALDEVPPAARAAASDEPAPSRGGT